MDSTREKEQQHADATTGPYHFTQLQLAVPVMTFGSNNNSRMCQP